MKLLQHSNEQRRVVIWFFAALIAAKIMYSIVHDFSEFHSWEQNGLFEYNKKSDLINSFIFGGLFSLLPYAFFGLIGTLFSRRTWLAVSLGIAVAGSDIFSELCFRGSTDAQTGISMGIVYLGLLFCVFVYFLICNLVLNRYQPDAAS